MDHIMVIFCRLLVVCALANQAKTRQPDCVGRKFMFALPTPYKPSSVSGTYRPLFHIIISTPSTSAVSGTLTIPGVSFREAFTTTFNRPGNVTVEATDYLGYSFDISPRTVTVETTNGDVSVHIAYTYSNFASEWLMGTTNVMPVPALGTTYYVASYEPYSSRKSEFTVTATDISGPTRLTFTTSTNQHFIETLQPSETFRFQNTEDLTGSLIVADKPVSVMSGSGCSKIPTTKDRCNYLVVHLSDVKSAGTEFLLAPFKDRTSGYIYRIIATEDNTNVVLTGQTREQTDTIHAGEMYERDISVNEVWHLKTSAPVVVFKYGKGGSSSDTDGDPIMIIVPAVSQFVREVTFPVMYLPTRRDSEYSISITIQCGFTEGILLDGVVQDLSDVLTSASDFCVVRLPVGVGIHSLSHRYLGASFAVEVHAISYKIGYTYQAGYNVYNSEMAEEGSFDYVPQYLGENGLGLVCGPSEMTVFVNQSLLIDGDAADVHFLDPTCFGKLINGTVIGVVAPYSSCGTEEQEGENMSLYKNKLIYTGPRNPGPIIRDPTFDIPVTCSYNSRVLVSLALSPKSQTVNQSLDGVEQFLNVTYSLQMFHSKTYNKAYAEEDFPVVVELEQSVYFEASVTGVPNLKLMPQQCLTTKTSDPLQLPNYIFVDNGCPTDDTVTFYKADDNSTRRFSLKMFAFLQNENGDIHNKAYIHCWLLACNNSDGSSRCNSDCSDAGRSQRDAVKQSNQDLRKSQHVYIRQGPIILSQGKHTGSSSMKAKVSTVIGACVAVLGLILLVILILFVVLKIRKQRRGIFYLTNKHKGDDVQQLIELTNMSS